MNTSGQHQTKPAINRRAFVKTAALAGAAWDTPAITSYEPNNNAVRTEKWRYIRYVDDTEELHDHDTDPLEWKNLATDPQHAAVKETLEKWMPKNNVPPQIPRGNREMESNLEQIARKNARG